MSLLMNVRFINLSMLEYKNVFFRWKETLLNGFPSNGSTEKGQTS